MPDDTLPKGSDFAEYDDLLMDVSRLLERARQSTGRAVNAIMTATYWQIGRRIVEQEQLGSDRASYGEELVARLAKDLTTRFGRGFSRTNVVATVVKQRYIEGRGADRREAGPALLR
jgi:DUF1016 N-terminal domain